MKITKFSSSTNPTFIRSVKRVLAAMLGIVLVWYVAPRSDASAGSSEKRIELSKAFKGRLPITELTEDEAILHALNRLGFGPRPGDVERVRQMGLERWIDGQLNPESIPDAAMSGRLERYPTLTMTSARLLKDFPPPQKAAKDAGLTPEEYREQQQALRRAKREAAAPMDDSQASQSQQAATNANMADQAGGKNGFVKPAVAKGGNAKPPRIPRLDDINGPQRVMAELAVAKMDRAIHSERQLYEVMVDFWTNHFNVYAGKGADRWLLTAYDRDTIRPHALGKFKDLLDATAKSPAMLFYLDNWQSVDPKAFAEMQSEIAARRQEFQRYLGRMYPLLLGPEPPPLPQQQAQNAPSKPQKGLNENYGRELMELHTLGVDGGYTQKDVTEVARAFTGWTIRTPRRAAEFYFAPRLHDASPKYVLGHKIDRGGMKDGEEVLDMLAHHPSTAHFISLKLAQRFVTDQPPQELVDRMAKTFRDSDGDIKAVLRTMIYSPEFWSRSAYRAKIKMPFELVASTARALNLASVQESDEAIPLVQWTARIGEPLYQCEPPTGYSVKSETWVNTGALLNRINFALALAGNRVAGLKADVPALLGEPLGTPASNADSEKMLDQSIRAFLGGDISVESRATLERKMNDPRVAQARLDDPVKHADVGLIAGLVLGSPEFQRR